MADVEKTQPEPGSAYSRLPVKQRRFVDAWLGEANGNGARAARLAGYASTSARKTAWDLLNDPAYAQVQAAIRERLEAHGSRKEAILAQLEEIRTCAQAEFLQPNGSYDLARLIEAGLGHLVKKTKWDRFNNLVIEWHDPLRAAELLGRYHGLWSDKTEEAGAAGEPEIREVVIGLDRSGTQPEQEPDGGNAQPVEL